MRQKRKKQVWKAGDVFLIPQRDGMCSFGQVLDTIMRNVVSCSFYNIRTQCNVPESNIDLPVKLLIAVLSVTREQLDFGEWQVVGNQSIALDSELWPNEEFRENRWIGTKIYDAAIAESLLDAYNGLVPWDAWHDPEYLDKLLASPDGRPKNVILRKSAK